MAEKSGNETIPVREFYIRALKPEDRNWVADFLDSHWMSTKIVSRGQIHYGHLLPGFAAFPGISQEEADPNSKALGLLTYRLEEDRWFLVLFFFQRCYGYQSLGGRKLSR